MNNTPMLLPKISKLKLFKLTPARIILLGFSLVILIGAIMLYLPFSSQEGTSTSFTDSLFTSVSSVCVTGLVVADTNTQWSSFGKAIILLLIQIGALGIMSVVTLFFVFTGKKLGLRDRLTIQESINNFSLGGIVRTFQGILIVTIVVEVLGALVFLTEFVPLYGFKEGLAKSVFHAVSSFCNAGFDTFGTGTNPFTSLIGFNNRPLVILTTGLLIIIGGLGFIVWNDLAVKRKFSKLTLHSKLVIVTSCFLLLMGTLGFLLFEYNNPATIGNMPFGTKILNSFFQAVTTRTAGFNTIPTGEMNETSNFLAMILMFIGGAPGSTAGGIKVTTFSIIILTVLGFIKGREEVFAFERRVPEGIIIKSLMVIVLGLFTVVTVTTLLLYLNDITFLQSLYEVVSAFANVGLSTGITSGLSTLSKYLLMITMLIGRIGPFTAIIAFTAKQDNQKSTYQYPEGKITVG